MAFTWWAGMVGYLRRRRYGLYLAHVDPLAIRYVKTSGEWPSYVEWWPFLCCPGRWDVYEEELTPFRERQMRQLFVEGRHYSETDEYARLTGELRTYGATRFPTCRSKSEIEAYFGRVYELYESMRESGCKPPSEASGDPSDGITVRISREGKILKCREGTHRLAIARLLRLPLVPVVIDLVHLSWVRECHRKFGAGVAAPVQRAVSGTSRRRRSSGTSRRNREDSRPR